MTRIFKTGINVTGASVSGSIVATQAWVTAQGYGSGSGGGAAIVTADEGTTVNTNTTNFNFVGAGVTVTNPGSGSVTITIPSGSSGGNSSSLGGLPAASYVKVNAASVGSASGITFIHNDNATGTILISQGSSSVNEVYQLPTGNSGDTLVSFAWLANYVQSNTGTIGGLIINPNSLYNSSSNGFPTATIFAPNPINTVASTVFLSAGGQDTLGSSPTFTITYDGTLTASVLSASTAKFTAASVGGAAIATATSSVAGANNSASLGGQPASFYAPLANPNFTTGASVSGSIIATQAWVTNTASAFNAANLGGTAASAYAKLASSNFTAASVGGVAIATTSSSVAGANNSASLGGVAAATYARLPTVSVASAVSTNSSSTAYVRPTGMASATYSLSGTYEFEIVVFAQVSASTYQINHGIFVPSAQWINAAVTSYTTATTVSQNGTSASSGTLNPFVVTPDPSLVVGTTMPTTIKGIFSSSGTGTFDYQFKVSAAGSPTASVLPRTYYKLTKIA